MERNDTYGWKGNCFTDDTDVAVMFDLIENKLVPRIEIDEEHRNEIFDVEQKEWIDTRILIMVGTKWFRYCE